MVLPKLVCLLCLVSTPGGGARLSKESLAPGPPAPRTSSPGVGDPVVSALGICSYSPSRAVSDTREDAGRSLGRSPGVLNIFQF